MMLLRKHAPNLEFNVQVFVAFAKGPARDSQCWRSEDTLFSSIVLFVHGREMGKGWKWGEVGFS